VKDPNCNMAADVSKYPTSISITWCVPSTASYAACILGYALPTPSPAPLGTQPPWQFVLRDAWLLLVDRSCVAMRVCVCLPRRDTKMESVYDNMTAQELFDINHSGWATRLPLARPE
jgi:hypothetical protein